ncbi:CAP domain-containing protein [Sphaerisporangium fuscum]|uniref:CAP domain-containing protein n=1 Tax=Sphaerisporangium fuscum TaxID=2835868 RepID=UPI001BDC8212|nr:CAP domain-containing protein [Sphaerisporangium fuscum]
MGLLACLTAALLAAVVISRLDASHHTTDELYLSTGPPPASPRQMLAAPRASSQAAATDLPELGHVARPSARPGTARVRPEPTPTATKRRDIIDGSGSDTSAGTTVGAAVGPDEAGPDDSGGAQDGPPAAQLEAAAVRLTNQERVKRGCGPLRVDPRLARAARQHSLDMATRDYFGHTSPGGQSPWDRMARAGYANSAAENIARGYQSAEEAVRGWMSNPGHRRNILNCQIRTVGVGVAYGSGDTWWTQDFGYS